MIKINNQELKKIQLEILDDVVKFCENNNLTYFLTGGTMLGAVRHKGYIPWDDDIDILIPRKDYNILLERYNRVSHNNLKFLSSSIDKDYPYAYAKVINTKTILKEYIDIDYKMGVYIDIFPLENLTDDLGDVLKLNEKISFCRKLMDVIKIKDNINRKLYRRVFLALLKIFTKLVDYRKVIAKIEKLSQTYINNENSKYVAVMTLLTYGKREIVERKLFSQVEKLEFEGKVYNVPCGYHEYLTKMYGDYMKLPPKEKQVTHHLFEAWWVD